MKQIGILGGTFNPVHNGHLMMASAALSYGLDEIWFLPAATPPHKISDRILPVSQRLQMLSNAIATMSSCFVSTFEIDLGGINYTANTLHLLNQKYQGMHFCFLMGEDSFLSLKNWYQPEKIMKEAAIMAFPRGHEIHDSLLRMSALKECYQKKYEAKIQIASKSLPDISSQQIRMKIMHHEDISDLVPLSVYRYIQDNHLYQNIDGNLPSSEE